MTMRWSDDDIATLKQLWSIDRVSKIASILGRSSDAIRKKAKTLGLGQGMVYCRSLRKPGFTCDGQPVVVRRSPEQRERRRQYDAKRYAALTPEQREQKRRNEVARYAVLTPEQREQKAARRREQRLKRLIDAPAKDDSLDTPAQDRDDDFLDTLAQDGDIEFMQWQQAVLQRAASQQRLRKLMEAVNV